MRRFIFSSLLAFCCALGAAQPPSAPNDTHFDGKSWWEKVKVIADDKMEGRDTGSRGERLAQQYAIEQFKQAGVQPAGANGFYQPVKFISRRLVQEESSLALINGSKREPLTIGEDALIGTRVSPAPSLKADLVFAGYGLKIPEANYDDFAGLDCKGKLVVTISGSPSEIAGAIASHYQTSAERWKTLKSVGAIGMITIRNPALVEIPWPRMALSDKKPSMDLDYPEFNETVGEQLTAYFNPEHAEKLFAGSSHTASEVIQLAEQQKPLPHFPLALSLEAHTKVETQPVESANVVGVLPGADPALKNEYVVLSAHLDHLGIGAPINGDRIYNGAMDDGSGSALVMDIAASLKAHPEKLQRSILFLLVTAEEKGLLGSKYFASHPTVAPKSIVADVNVDMFLPIVPLKILKIEGIEESDLGTRAAAIAQSMGLRPIPDPEPLRNAFIRSDQYSFIKKGVPAVKVDVGFELGTPEQKIFKEWLTNRYHAPSDDVNQPVDLQAAAGYEEFTRRLLLDTANSAARPNWKPDSFFRRYAAD